MTTTIDNPGTIKAALTRVYGELKFTSREAEEALNDLGSLQRIAVFTELLRSLTENEAAELFRNFADKSEDEQKKMTEEIAKSHAADKEYMSRAQEAAKKVLNEHIAYLKTRGSDDQKKAIGKILSEIGQ